MSCVVWLLYSYILLLCRSADIIEIPDDEGQSVTDVSTENTIEIPEESPDTVEPSSSQLPLSELDHLITMFEGENLSAKQIAAIYFLSGSNYDSSVKCALNGPNLKSIVTLMNTCFDTMPRIKVPVDADSAWSDLVAYYKGADNYDCRIRIVLSNSPAVDTGGIRRQIYTQVYADFSTNRHIKLFDGPPGYLRPACTAIVRSSGLLKLLGKMLAHSIYQDGIGFPYLSPITYWYLIGGENMAIQYASTKDLPADSALLIEKVSVRTTKQQHLSHSIK